MIYGHGEFGTGLPCILVLQIWVHLAGRCSYIHHRLLLQAKVSPYCINLFSRGYSAQQQFCNCRSCNGIFFSCASSFSYHIKYIFNFSSFPHSLDSFYFICKTFPGSSSLLWVTRSELGRFERFSVLNLEIRQNGSFKVRSLKMDFSQL